MYVRGGSFAGDAWLVSTMMLTFTALKKTRNALFVVNLFHRLPNPQLIMHVGVSMTDLLQDADWTDGLSQSYIFLGVLESFGLCHFMFLQSKTIQDNPRQN